MLHLRKKNLTKLTKNKNYGKVRDNCHYTHKSRSAAHSICNLKFNVTNKTVQTMIIILLLKELANEFEGKLECLGENTEMYKRFSVTIEKDFMKIYKDGDKSVVNISYKIKFIYSARFMVISLSNLAENLTDRIYQIKCKDCDCFLEY